MVPRYPVRIQDACATQCCSRRCGYQLAVGVAVLSFLTLLSFHCLLRPAEARSLRWCDLHCFTEDDNCRYPGVYGLIGIRLPKTRRMPGHAAHQHVLVESEGLGRLMRALLWHFAPENRLQQLWTLRESQHLAQFHVVLQRLGVRRLRSEAAAPQNKGSLSAIYLIYADEAVGRLNVRLNATFKRELSACTHFLWAMTVQAKSKSHDPPPSPATTEPTERDE